FWRADHIHEVEMHLQAVLLAAALALAPLGARAADLVVWWEKGFNPEEDGAVQELVAAFEQQSGKVVELGLYKQAELPDKIVAALAAGQPPDFAWGLFIDDYIDEWARDGRLLDLAPAVGPLRSVFDPDAIEQSTLFNAQTGKSGLYAFPMARI